MFDRLKGWWIGLVAVTGVAAALLGNLDKIAGTIAQVLKPWLQPQTMIEVTFDENGARHLVVAVAEKDRVLDSQLLEPGSTAPFPVPANARYSLVWQGPGYKPASAEILAPRQALRWRLTSAGKEQDLELLKLREEEAQKEIATAPASAKILVGATAAQQQQNPAGPSSALQLLPEVDRALAIVGLFETGTTECGDRVFVSAFGISVGCIGFTLPGSASDIIKRLDAEEPALLDAALGAEADFIRLLAAKPMNDRADLQALAEDAERRRNLTEAMRTLTRSPEFRMHYQDLAFDWYRRALRLAVSLGLQSERGVLLVLDRVIQQGPGGISRVRSDYESRLQAAGNPREREKIRILVEALSRRPMPMAGLQARMIERMETIASGKRTIRGVEYDLDALGIRDDRPMNGMIARAESRP